MGVTMPPSFPKGQALCLPTPPISRPSPFAPFVHYPAPYAPTRRRLFRK